ncbi:glycosyltransferase family 4 protein [Kineosporia sp. R_H_3]|uniref:glycosyltransferase family 4 protein n=1 Tax=Kineosporia sp. R_H_3 TaxID=1961848 RepID=UPI001303FC63|nr:glycosyltransferase family 4 protein [Kineosporia sp. R_H_3]
MLQVIVTDNFAGAERYVATLSRALAEAGRDVTVVGGRPDAMAREAGPDVRVLLGRTLREALRSVRAAGRFDVCHAHMTFAEAVAVAGRSRHRAPIVATRHFAAPRGASLPGRLAAGWISRNLSAEIAISEFVAGQLERRPAAVVLNGVEPRTSLWRADNRTVLLLQRLEAEKDAATGLRAWAASGLAAEGWHLRVVGEGRLRPTLESTVQRERIHGVTFVGWVGDVDAELAAAGLMLATAPAEPLGLSVLEGMAAGIPVVAAAGGGHLETTGLLPMAPVFTPGDAAGAALQLRRVAMDESLRRQLSETGQELQRLRFSLGQHVEAVVGLYAKVSASVVHA